jgi:hypothetical protein
MLKTTIAGKLEALGAGAALARARALKQTA